MPDLGVSAISEELTCLLIGDAVGANNEVRIPVADVSMLVLVAEFMQPIVAAPAAAPRKRSGTHAVAYIQSGVVNNARRWYSCKDVFYLQHGMMGGLLQAHGASVLPHAIVRDYGKKDTGKQYCLCKLPTLR